MLLPSALNAQVADTVCFGDAPAQFNSVTTATGSIGVTQYIYSWQDSTAGGSWAAAPGINGDTLYQAQALTETTFFRREVRVLLCLETAYSNVIQVIVLDSLEASLSGTTNANCENTADGSATVDVLGGLPPYSYLWDNGETTAAATGLAPGLHTVTITDDKGCEVTSSATIGFDNPSPTLAFVADTISLASEIVTTFTAPSGFASYMWSDGSTDSTVTITSTGLYSLTVTNAEGCEAIDSIYVILTVGIADASSKKEARVYPNPARQEVNVMIGSSETPDRVEIRTMEGRVVQVELNQSNINISDLSGGVYFLDIQQGDQSWIKQLIVQ